MENNEAAFDEWLRRHLADMHDDVLREPLPDELMHLLDSTASRG